MIEHKMIEHTCFRELLFWVGSISSSCSSTFAVGLVRQGRLGGFLRLKTGKLGLTWFSTEKRVVVGSSLRLLAKGLYLVWTFFTRPSRSTCPAAYCSMTSFTSYGFNASLNLRRATKYFICGRVGTRWLVIYDFVGFFVVAGVVVGLFFGLG